MSKSSAFMILASLFFVMAHSIVKSLDRIPLHEVIAVRIFVSVFLCGLYFAYHRTNPIRQLNRHLWLRGFFGIFAMGLFFYTLRAMPLATAITINYLAPMFAVIFSILIMKEWPHKSIWPLLALAFVGVLLTKGFDTQVSWIPLGVALSAAMSAGLAYAYIRKAGLRSGPMLVIFVLPFVGIFPVTTTFFIFDSVWPTGLEWLLLLLMSLFVFLAQIFMTLSYVKDQVSNVTIPRYLTIVWSLGMGYFIFNETLSLGSLGGIGCIVLALLLSEIFKPRRSRPQRVFKG